jgi:short-subunit dehydrogenase
MERMLAVNYLGSLYWTRLLLPAMVDRGSGHLVFVSSVAGRLAPPRESAYAASKFAVTGLADSLSLELEESGVSVLSVYPGTVRTPFFDEEALADMPTVARRSMVEVSDLVGRIIAAIDNGRRELTWPRFIAAGYAARALAPSFFRRSVLRSTS